MGKRRAKAGIPNRPLTMPRMLHANDAIARGFIPLATGWGPL